MVGFARNSSNKACCVVSNETGRCQLLRPQHYLPAGLVPHLANLTFDLKGVLPDAFGLDIGLAGGTELNNALAIFPKLCGLGAAGWIGVGGNNILWHSCGDLQAGWPGIY